MEYFDLKKLKSGTDIRGVAYGADENITLSDEAVACFSVAFACFLRKKLGKSDIAIAIGHDSRLSAKRIEKTAANALCDNGVNVYLTGLSSTPSMFMSLQNADVALDGSIMITASHLPFERNGLKFFVKSGGLESCDIDELISIASDITLEKTVGGSINELSYMPKYCSDLVSFVRNSCKEEKPFDGMKIVVDAGNGAGGFYADILKELGADTSGSQFLEPDGRFPNHIPNPEDHVAMDSISSCVLKNNADIGVIFDTDVDRAAIVSSKGEEINRNALIALISAILLKERKGTIVTDSITSLGLNEFISSLGGIHYRYRRGYKNVINKAIELNESGEYAPLAIETSGHAALKENYFLDDGAYLVTRILIEAAKLNKQGLKLESLISNLKMPKEAVEVRMTFYLSDFAEYGKKVLEEFKIFAENEEGLSLEEPNYEGVRVNFDKDHGNGWCLLRMSLHDPIMPLNFESEIDGGVNIMAKTVYGFMKKFESLNTDNLKRYI